jgi:hypothetical protein
MAPKWNEPNEIKLLLIILAHYDKRGGGPNWDSVAQLMGEGYTSGAVSQHYTKKLVKMDTFVVAKAALGDRTASAPSSPSKKRKAGDDAPMKKEEPEL